MTKLRWSVHVTPSIVTAITDMPPDLDVRVWSPISATLIYGETDAVLVDPFMTVAQADDVAAWVESFDRTLRHIYVTHAHGDHWFGLGTLLRKFPAARAIATPGVVAAMQTQLDPDFLRSFWKSRFPGQIPDDIRAPDALDGDRFELEGEELRIVDLGHTDTDSTTALFVPSIGLVVAGDAVYNDVHLYLAESPKPQRQEWLDALDLIASLEPSAVIAGHKRDGRPDAPTIIEETRRYIRDFDDADAATDSALALYEEMRRRHPDRVNPGALWSSARVAKP